MKSHKWFITTLKRSPRFGPSLAHHQEIPGSAAVYADPSVPLPDPLPRLLNRMGIQRLYKHQADALDLARSGKNVVVATPTSSGKTLIYSLPVLERIIQNPGSASALYLFPLKALARDQHRVLKEVEEHIQPEVRLRSAVYDGDTGPAERKQIRMDPPHVLISNPDMLHLGILPYHSAWENFFRRLEYVVIDELHAYRGIFGSHVAQVIRRMQRILSYYGVSPTYVLSSATISNAGEFANRLTDRQFEVIGESGAPRGARHFLFFNPEFTSTGFTAAQLFAHCMREGLKTIVFTQSRRVTELVHVWVKQLAPELSDRISSYRAGFLPEERRTIERDLSTGKLAGVISTSALEMGIDIGGLDVCVLVGYPGTIMATWQRGGRVGREDRDAIICLIAQPNALDQYFVRHPQDFFSRGYERAVLDPENSEVLKAHLPCAADELPIRSDDPAYPPKKYLPLLKQLAEGGTLRPDRQNELWYSVERYPHRSVEIRSVGESFTVINADTSKAIGRVEGLRAFKECHPGAVYLHRASQFEILGMDIENTRITARHAQVPYYTRSQSEKETEILEVLKSRPCENFLVKLGRLRVTERVTGYEKRRIRGQELISKHELNLPDQVFETVGIWIEIDDVIRRIIEKEAMQFMGGIHALEHAAIAMFPLLALCDRNDLGGISIPFHAQVGKSAVFLYDGYPGGVGLADQGFDLIEELLRKTLELVSDCDCEDGCPSCIHSPKCGNGNKPLDKSACILCLELLLNVRDLSENESRRISNSDSKPSPEPAPCGPPRVLFLDVETRRSAQEVGGWNNAHLMRVAVVVIYDLHEDRFLEFQESEVRDLVDLMLDSDLVVGFNVKRFDYGVLKAYTSVDLKRIPTFDILEYVHKKIGRRVSLDKMASATLGVTKSGDGLQSLEWVRKGMMDRVAAYCRKDVEITRDLFLHGMENRFVCYRDERGRNQRIEVDWNLDKIIRRKPKPDVPETLRPVPGPPLRTGP